VWGKKGFFNKFIDPHTFMLSDHQYMGAVHQCQMADFRTIFVIFIIIVNSLIHNKRNFSGQDDAYAHRSPAALTKINPFRTVVSKDFILMRILRLAHAALIWCKLHKKVGLFKPHRFVLSCKDLPQNNLIRSWKLAT
jgi:hypothetical protein